MIKGNLNSIAHKRGTALIYVIIALVVISVLSGIIVNLVYSNLMMAKAQERNLQAYYLSLSGSDLSMAALVETELVQLPEVGTDTLLYLWFNPSVINPPPHSDTLTLDGGVVNLIVKLAPDGTYGAAGERWIEISSTATLSDSPVSRTTVLAFLYSNILVQKKTG